jgi:glycosyltransferase involved in cell wall biosynthesis
MPEKIFQTLPMVSVVTPSLNQGKFIEGTIRSVLEQSYPNLEYIVVDGGSTDETRDILRRYDGRLTSISEKDRGQTDAVNKGFRMAHGEIFGWMNADDQYCPGAISEALDCFIRDPDVMLVYGAAKDIDVDGKYMQNYPTESFDFEKLPYRCIISQPAAFMRKSLIEHVGYLNADLECSMDLDLWIRCGLAQKANPQWKFVYIPHFWALNRFHSESKSLVLRKKHLEITKQMVTHYFGFTPFNWIYGLNEVAGGEYDGIFSKSPLKASLVLTSVVEWIWENRRSPGHILEFGIRSILSPRASWRSLRQRAADAPIGSN